MQAQCKHRASANRAPHAARQTAHFDCEPGFHRPVTIWAKAHVFFSAKSLQPPSRDADSPTVPDGIENRCKADGDSCAHPMQSRLHATLSERRSQCGKPALTFRQTLRAQLSAMPTPKQTKKTVPIPVRPIALPPACSSDTCRPASANSQAILAVPALANPLAMRTCPRHMPSLASLQTPPWQTFARRLFFLRRVHGNSHRKPSTLTWHGDVPPPTGKRQVP